MQYRMMLVLLAFLTPLSLGSEGHVSSSLDGATTEGTATSAKSSFFVLRHFDSYIAEGFAATLLLLMIIFAIRGRRTNEQLAVSYASSLLRPDGPLERHFASLSDAQLFKEGPAFFKIYTTGRRYCLGAQINLRMAKQRHDLLAKLLNSSNQDILDMEIAMNEGAMPMTTFFIGSSDASKVVPDENTAITKFTKPLIPAKDRLPQWPADDLVVLAEHASIVYEAIGAKGMELMFNNNIFPIIKPYFRFIHVSSDYKGSQHRHMVRVSMQLPASLEQAEVLLDRFVLFAMHVVDVLGAYKLTPEQAKKAVESRRRVEATQPSVQEERERRAEERRAAKEAEEKARLAKLSPEQREKEKARREKIQRERKMRQLAKR